MADVESLEDGDVRRTWPRSVWHSRVVDRSRLHITGASGSGTTTLGRAIATAWSVPHADTDDYFWVPTSPPFTDKRDEAQRIALMTSLFLDREAWVLSGSIVGWGDAILDRCDAVVFLTLDTQTRMRRLERRERLRRAGGPVDEDALAAFLEWAQGYDRPDFIGRSRAGHEVWLASLTCPVLRLDAGCSVEDLRDQVLEWTPGR